MAPKGKFQLHWLVGGIFIFAFVVLFAFRLEILSADRPGRKETLLPRLMERETWRIIYQEGVRVGYVRRMFTIGSRGYNCEESVFLRLMVLGSSQEVWTDLQATLEPDLSLSSFTYHIGSGLLQYRLQGLWEEGRLVLLAGMPGRWKRTFIPTEKRPHLSITLTEMLSQLSWRQGEVRTYELFDFTHSLLRPVEVEFLGRERLSLAGRAYEAKKYAVAFAGIRQVAWVSDEGEVLREAGPLGIVIELANKEEALKDLPALNTTQDLAFLTSIPADKPIEVPNDLSRLAVRLVNLPRGDFFLVGGRQSQRGEELVVLKEDKPGMTAKLRDPPSHLALYLKPTAQIQVDHEQVKKILATIILPSDHPVLKAEKIVDWVYRHIEKKPVVSVPNALDTLINRVGDCNEHAMLVAALGRAAGIPTLIEAGLVYQGGRFYYHAWNVFYLDGWITADGTLNQFPADVTHLRFVRGEGAEQVNLLGLIGKLKVEITEMAR